MRCLACNKALTDKESVFKDSRGEYTDMCFECLPFVYDSFEDDDNYEEVDKEDDM